MYKYNMNLINVYIWSNYGKKEVQIMSKLKRGWKNIQSDEGKIQTCGWKI